VTFSTRITKAVKVINEGKIKRLGENTYQVEGTGGTRQVTLDPPYYTCTCPWGDRKWLGNACYHALAACGLADVDVPLEPEEVKDE
jgi:hypothetical protein